jgi:hypothetical protein
MYDVSMSDANVEKLIGSLFSGIFESRITQKENNYLTEIKKMKRFLPGSFSCRPKKILIIRQEHRTDLGCSLIPVNLEAHGIFHNTS